MVYKITRFDNITNPGGGVPQTYETLPDLYTQFNKCAMARTEQDKKNSAGWVRGHLKDNYRKKENIEHTQFIIIDVDKSSGKPYCIEPPEKIHQIMKDFNINHIMHTTWSNRGDGKYRYRIIIPCTRNVWEEEVEINSRDIVGALKDAGCDILYAHENKSMSQMWFFPSSPAPTKWFQSYLYCEGEDYNPSTIDRYKIEKEIKGAPTNKVLSIFPDVVASDSLYDMFENVRTHQDIHGNLLNITYQLVKDEVPDGWIMRICNYLLGEPTDDKRIEQRRADLPRMIQGAKLKRLDENKFEAIEWISADSKYEDPPIPPGRLGELVKMAYRQQSYQNKTIALVSSLGMISGVAGYKFQCPSVPSMGCNDYFLLSMKTGGGKDFASRFIISGLAKASKDNSYRQFIGNKTFTSGKAIRNMLEKKRCCVSVITEMGQVLASISGDPVSTRRAFLEVYSKSGPDDIVAEEGYSKDEDSIKELSHPALTIVGEGEPSGFIRALKSSNSTTDGFAPRCLIFRADRERRPYENKDIDLSWDDDILEHLSHLLKECTDMTLPYFMRWESSELEQDVKRHSDKWTDYYNDYDGINELKSVLSTRMHVHAVKLSTICAVMNRRELIVTKEDWEWAKELVMYCFNQAQSFMDSSTSGEGDGTIEDTLKIIAHTLRRYFAGDFKGGNFYRDKYSAERNNIIIERCFRTLFASKPAIKKLSRNNKPGYDVVVEYFLQKKYMEKLVHNKKIYYLINNNILELFCDESDLI
jgi:hypothetical protein